MTPVLSIVGKSNSGKTTLLEKLIAELILRGVKVAAVKHDAHSFNIDHEGKDSWRLARAGAGAVLIGSPEKFAMIRKLDREWSLDDLIAQLGDDFDIVLTEGYKGAAKPKMEVLRAERSTELICKEEELIGVITDVDLDVSIPKFGLNDVDGISDFIQKRFLS